MAYKELTFKIMRCAMEVHNAVGNGFQEARPLGVEMTTQGIGYSREHEMRIDYEE